MQAVRLMTEHGYHSPMKMEMDNELIDCLVDGAVALIRSQAVFLPASHDEVVKSGPLGAVSGSLNMNGHDQINALWAQAQILAAVVDAECSNPFLNARKYNQQKRQAMIEALEIFVQYRTYVSKLAQEEHGDGFGTGTQFMRFNYLRNAGKFLEILAQKSPDPS